MLDEKPPGRTPVETALVSSGRTAEVVEHLRRALADGRQAYWVCPLVAESETAEMTAAEERFRALRVALGADAVGLVHGQLPPGREGRRDGRLRRGPHPAPGRHHRHRGRGQRAQRLDHGDRGRPGLRPRPAAPAARPGRARRRPLDLLLLYDPPLGETARARLETMRATEDGFVIAEEDLALRGAGDLLGVQQSGLPKFRIADLETQAELMRIAQDDARLLLDRDPGLASPRGAAVRLLLYLMERDKAIRLLAVG